jgi:signal transduction histidine kinase
MAALILGTDSGTRLFANAVAKPGDITVTVLAVTLAAATLVSAALVVSALEPLRARRAVDRVARLLAGTGAAADVQTIFRKGFGDPGLRVGYWADGAGYLDAHGDPVDATAGGTRIELTSHGLPLAIVEHAPGTVSPELLTRQLGSQARLAIHNESLAFELNRRVAEVGRSRRRIVEVSDAERRRLERDLHDGAQQRLLALSFELRRGERAATAADDRQSADRFRSANALAQTALVQLRDLAHGIHPVILDGEGLGDALRQFASSTGCRMSIAIELTDPIPAPLDSTVYGVLTAAVGDTSATTADIAVRRDGERISLAIDGVAELSQQAVDRAEAVGGNWVRTEHGFEVTLPCAS